MYGMPSDFAPTGFDPSHVLALGLHARRAGDVDPGRDGARHPHAAGLLPVLCGATESSASSPTVTGWFPAKLVLIMFRGLRRSPLAHVADLSRAVRPHAGALPHLRGPRHDRRTRPPRRRRTSRPSSRTRRSSPARCRRAITPNSSGFCFDEKEVLPKMRPVNGEKDMMSWSFVLGTTDKVNPRKDTMRVPLRARAGQGDDDDGRPRRPDRRGDGACSNAASRR